MVKDTGCQAVIGDVGVDQFLSAGEVVSSSLSDGSQ